MAVMISAQTPVDKLKAMMTHLEVACLCWVGREFRSKVLGDDSGQVCTDCQGSGVQHPLRLDCPGYISCEGPHGSLKLICLTKISYPATFSSIPKNKCQCHGEGYVFNPDPDALFAAIDSIGDSWGISKWSGGSSWQVNIWVDARCIGMVSASENLRGTYALWLAVCRALEYTKEAENARKQ